MQKDGVRETLIDIIEISRNCIKFIDDDEDFLTHKIALRLSVMDIKLMKLAKELKGGIE